jgi:hypothetical protein
MEAVGYYKEVSAAGKGNLICNWFLITRGGGGYLFNHYVSILSSLLSFGTSDKIGTI